jgi:hypothetical protein
LATKPPEYEHLCKYGKPPQCSDQDKDALKAFGVATSDKFECLVDKVADPAGLFRRLALGQPVSKLVREQ